MKNNQEFLTSMWNEISQAEIEAALINSIKKNNKKLIWKTLLIYGLITVLCVLGLYLLPTITEEATTYLISSVLLPAVYIMENKSWRTVE